MKFEIFGRSFSFLADSNQQEKALQMLEKYVFKPEIIILLIILAVYFIFLLITKIRRNSEINNKLQIISPWVYLLVILGITVLNRTPGSRELRIAFDNWFTPTGFHETSVLGFIFNLALYIPFGYLLKKYGKAISAGVTIIATSFIIEVSQYIFARGVTAIDDLFANILGGLIGICIAVIVQKIKQKQH